MEEEVKKSCSDEYGFITTTETGRPRTERQE